MARGWERLKCWDNPELGLSSLVRSSLHLNLAGPEVSNSFDLITQKNPTWASFQEADLHRYILCSDAGHLPAPSAPSWLQGNCTFNSWTVEIQAMNGGWLQNPLGCADLTQFAQTTCDLTGSPGAPRNYRALWENTIWLRFVDLPTTRKSWCGSINIHLFPDGSF